MNEISIYCECTNAVGLTVKAVERERASNGLRTVISFTEGSRLVIECKTHNPNYGDVAFSKRDEFEPSVSFIEAKDSELELSFDN
jgi:hypothetical protein